MQSGYPYISDGRARQLLRLTSADKNRHGGCIAFVLVEFPENFLIFIKPC